MAKDREFSLVSRRIEACAEIENHHQARRQTDLQQPQRRRPGIELADILFTDIAPQRFRKPSQFRLLKKFGVKPDELRSHTQLVHTRRPPRIALEDDEGVKRS